ncbi:uncharacterized protein SPPG_01723 [Spizellomyces punctatus DAOM BR117]|uniref:Uncharacterized protein n=1 Tax=Spizellomyces punctatus (strain DAOM BR117) TaxID=645134 RepID=A0A0L0HNW5_SPIPD|nr:uncharacterized protein SPPG_01723 [Spizellomyces punctatus DAOM BR117]KND02635.1 hypothetical protein SPPG_01723 [Spizellomyces punctatus DAOM BR117]|eukprot:XP_016610674.1 hypothetical protein SPPG_01723 [Spizellomyces punctatus DAOM BR117]
MATLTDIPTLPTIPGTPLKSKAAETRALFAELPHPSTDPMIATHGFGEAEVNLLHGGFTTSTTTILEVELNVADSQRRYQQKHHKKDIIVIEEEPCAATRPESCIPPHHPRHPHAVEAPTEGIKVVDEEPAKLTVPVTFDAIQEEATRTIVEEEPCAASVPESTIPPHHPKHPHAVESPPEDEIQVVDEEPAKLTVPVTFDAMEQSAYTKIVEEEPCAATVPQSTIPPHHPKDHPHAVESHEKVKVIDEEPAKLTVPVTFDAMADSAAPSAEHHGDSDQNRTESRKRGK